MTVLTVLRFPDERLRTKAEEVTEVNDDIRKIVDDMFETMYAENGVGLAATQVNIHQANYCNGYVSEDKSDPNLCAQSILKSFKKSEETMINEEGCLSVPGLLCQGRHAMTQVTVKALRPRG